MKTYFDICYNEKTGQALNIYLPETEEFAVVLYFHGGGLSWRCAALKNMPVWAFHGDMDDVVPIKNSVEMVDSTNKYGGNARLTIFHNVDHGSWG